MGTYVQQTVLGEDSSARTEAAGKANSAIVQLENLLSWRLEGSGLQKLNEHAGKNAVSLDPVTAQLLQISLDVAKSSGGAFDPTILPVSLLWNFSEKAEIVPKKAEIQKHLQYVDYQQLLVDGDKNTGELKLKHAAVNLDGVGKGAACDAAVQAYGQSNATGAIVSVGGSVGVYGSKKDGSDWGVYLRDPNGTPTDAMGTVRISSGFLSTSGTYEQTFQKDGVTYHHILNPETGYPAETDLISATVYCENGALSDALSTACIVLGLEKAQNLLEQYDAGGVFVTTDNRVIVTDNLKDRVTITSDQYTLE